MRKWAVLALLVFGMDGCVPPCEDCGGGYYEPGDYGGGNSDRDRHHDRGDQDRGDRGGGRHGGDRDGHRGDHHGDHDRDHGGD
jgi:hypothetical protein